MVVELAEQFSFSSVESKGLGFQVWRGRLNAVDPKKMRTVLTKNKVDLAIISIPAEKKDALLSIQEIGFPYLLADILVYLYQDLNAYDSEEMMDKPGIEIVQMTVEHVSLIDKLIDKIFKGYQNHYTANPLLSPDLITIYQEWTRSYMLTDDPGRMGWIVKTCGKYVAFATCELSATKSEICLTGVVPEFRGRRVFSSLIRYLLNHFKGQGISQIRVSTQLHNYAAQRVYTIEGFVIEEAFLTVHINSMLTSNIG